MDAKLYYLTVASNRTLAFKNFPVNKKLLKTASHWGLNFMNYSETPVKLQIPSALLETPLIRNI